MATLEIWDARGRDSFTLAGECVVIGSAQANVDLVLADSTVSRVHARLDRTGDLWMMVDQGSLNGTFLKGRRIAAPRRLEHGDDIVVGRTKLVYLDRESEKAPGTNPLDEIPPITRRERDVLIELCRPVLSGSIFIPPATVHTIKDRLEISRSAVEQHLLHLYDKFRILDHPDNETERRVQLANEAVQRGVIGPHDLSDG